MVCLQRGKLALVNNLYFQISSYQNILINLDLLTKNDNEYFIGYFNDVYDWNLV